MTKEYKYTSDGRKVVVVGKLNSKETIVQEIFVSDSVELPSGENFVVKSLHNSPAISWKEKSLKELDERYDRTCRKRNEEISRLEKDLGHKSKNLRLQIEANKKYSGLMEHEQFRTLVKFMCNDITHIVRHGYNTYEIDTFASCVGPQPNGTYEDSLKLVTLFGSGKCDFAWNINRYSDGSGGNKTILPFSSFEDAVRGLKEAINKSISRNGVNEGMLKAKEQYDLSVPSDEEIQKYYQGKAASLQEAIKKDELSLSNRKEKLKTLIMLLPPEHRKEFGG